MTKNLTLAMFAFMMALGGVEGYCANVALYVAPDGSDKNDGSEAKPFASLEAARDKLRGISASGGTASGATVWLKPGIHLRDKTFQLGANDSGAPEAPVVYRSHGTESARLVAGRMVKAADFKPVSDPALLARLDKAAVGKVVQLALTPLNLKHTKPFPVMFSGDGGIMELFVNDLRMPLSRWPNAGAYTTMKTVVQTGDLTGGPGTKGGTFVYRDERASRWVANANVWLQGFWRAPWEMTTVKVQSITTANQQITFASGLPQGLGSKYKRPQGNGKENWCAINLVEEIDQPGEWCIDFGSNTLYFWPPTNLAAAKIMISDMVEPVVEMNGASHAVLRGVTIEGGLGNGLEISGGTKILIAGCTLRNLGKTGVVIHSGTNNGVQSCDLYELGAGGIYINGGNRATLTPGNNFAENNHIHHYAIRTKTYEPGIKLGTIQMQTVGRTSTDDELDFGVGNRVQHNLIHDAPHAAVLYQGNDHLLEFNEIHHIAQDSGDVGAFYTWNDWTSRGNILRYNFVYQSPGCNAFYMDDGDSGDEIYGNVIYQASSGVFSAGGHDNLVRNNIAIECGTAYHLDNRGVPRRYNAQNKIMVSRLLSIKPELPPWSDRYPTLANFLKNKPELPTGSVIETNIAVRCKKSVGLSAKQAEDWSCSVRDNVDFSDKDDPGFVNAAALDFRLKPDSAVYAKVPGFKPIPFEIIGLRVDEYRSTLPKRINSKATSKKEVFDSAIDLKESNKIKN